jgi:hypothetical protein
LIYIDDIHETLDHLLITRSITEDTHDYIKQTAVIDVLVILIELLEKGKK